MFERILIAAVLVAGSTVVMAQSSTNPAGAPGASPLPPGTATGGPGQPGNTPGTPQSGAGIPGGTGPDMQSAPTGLKPSTGPNVPPAPPPK